MYVGIVTAPKHWHGDGDPQSLPGWTGVTFRGSVGRNVSPSFLKFLSVHNGLED